MSHYLTTLLAVSLALLSTAAVVHAADSEQPARLSLVVFDQGNPAPDLRLMVDGEPVGTTNAEGALLTRIEAGQHRLVLARDGNSVFEGELDTEPGEEVQMLLTLPATPSARAKVDISSSSAGDKTLRQSTRSESEGTPGALTGRVVSSESGEPVAGAKLYFAGRATEATTNESGRYEVDLPAGDYRVSVAHPDFATQKLSQVKVVAKQTVTKDIELSPAGLALADFVVTAPGLEGSVASVFETQRESSGVVDIIGAEQFSRTGASTAVEALRDVTGLTIEDGRFVVIRGQPERYTFTSFNGSPLPSPSPIRRIVPLDLFPTGVLQSIEVQKTYTPDRPGAFGGGLIQLNTREVPEETFLRFKADTGFNTLATGQDGLSSAGGSTDFLGIDDGTRTLPDDVDNVPDITDLADERQNQLGTRFPNNYDVDERTLPADTGLSIVGGTSTEALGGQLGVRASFSWDREFRTEDRIERTFSAAGEELRLSNDFDQRRADMNVRLGGLLTLGGEWGANKLTSNTFFVRDTIERTQIREGFDATSDGQFVRDFLLEFNQRQLLAQQFLGEHDFDVVRLNWDALLSFADRSSPDRRTYRYTRLPDGDFLIQREPEAVLRRFNDTSDRVTDFGVDVTVPVLPDVEGNRFTADLKTGVDVFNQTRESTTRRFAFTAADDAENLDSQNPEDFLQPDDIGGTVGFSEETIGIDSYTGDISVRGAYLQGDLRWRDVARVVGGVRGEQADFSALSFRASGNDTPGGFEDTNLLPAVTATYFIGDNMQVRGAWNKTVSRPVLNELSPAVFFDPQTGDRFNGNPDLQPAEITSYDLRWEWYPSDTERLTAGVFRKDFDNPIEEVLQPVGESSIVSSVENADSATVTGGELSARAGLGGLRALIASGPDWLGRARPWIGNRQFLDNLYIQGNLAIIDSSVTLDNVGVATSANRPLQGQANSVLNLQLGYDGEKHDLTVAYNRVGQRLFRPGSQGRPDIFREPIDSLGLVWKYRPFKHLQFGLELSNLLNPTEEITQGGQTFESFEDGVGGSVSLNYSFE